MQPILHNSAMTLKQKVLKILYPLLRKISRLAAGKLPIRLNTWQTVPPVPFYSLNAIAANGMLIDFETLQGKNVLLVNVASQCGYTSQYAELEKLYRQYKGTLEIIAFPSNDFKGQEPGSDSEIESFCRLNYGVSFPLVKKDAVTGTNQQAVFQWLTHKAKNGWNEQPPTWNFCKFLISKEGVLQEVFPPYISPLDDQVIRRLKE